MNPVRVRFAPSPTGALHIGGLRTALYNYLLARQTGGTMILRIEDTDQSRYVPGAEQYIQDSLAWAGIVIDEGPAQGGPHGPYRQSDRKDIYRKHVDQLLATGKAYYAFDSEEELEAMRNRQKEKGSSSLQYDHSTRMEMVNSLTLSAEAVQEKLRTSPAVVRMKVDPGTTVRLNDLIRGEVEFESGQVDDKVLLKSDGMPTYHLANVVDDHLMEITHVIRGEEWLPSAPLHVLLYQAFGWEQTMPRFAHLPLLLRPDGNGKLSKRDADQLGFPIFPLNWTDPRTGELAKGYRESGYLPAALLNFLAFLGWNPGTEQEIFSLNDLITAFSIERIGKAGAKFDIQKAQWFNQQYLRQYTNEELAALLQVQLHAENRSCPDEQALLIAQAMRERITFPHDLINLGRFFFEDPAGYDEQVVTKKFTQQTGAVLMSYADALREQPVVDALRSQQLFESICTSAGMKTGQVLQLLRVCLTGLAGGPDLMLTIQIIGGTRAADRISRAVAVF
ncbi:MAG: glutamate--tRNA ligase, partial [Bacteroidota bacterium]